MWGRLPTCAPIANQHIYKDALPYFKVPPCSRALCSHPENFPIAALPAFALPDPEYTRCYDSRIIVAKCCSSKSCRPPARTACLLSTTLEKVKEKYGDKVGILSVVLPPDNPGHRREVQDGE